MPVRFVQIRSSGTVVSCRRGSDYSLRVPLDCVPSGNRQGPRNLHPEPPFETKHEVGEVKGLRTKLEQRRVWCQGVHVSPEHVSDGNPDVVQNSFKPLTLAQLFSRVVRTVIHRRNLKLETSYSSSRRSWRLVRTGRPARGAAL